MRRAGLGVIARYRQYLPVTAATPIITLGEGNTPLVPAPSLSRALGRGVEVLLKYEGVNPTGSFKDRGMTVAVSKATEQGATAVICASTGNTSASAAAYAARAGLRCVVVIPQGAVALGKLAQALAHGAQVLAIRGNFDQALALVRQVAQASEIALVNSLNPYRFEGQQTGAFEICDALGRAPDYHAIPVGNAGNITAYWKGYRAYQAAGRIRQLPRMLGFQAAGAAPLVLGRPVATPKTVATAIRIGHPASWAGAMEAVRGSGGRMEAVSDRAILQAYHRLATEVGLFVEPASAASVAGVLALGRRGYFRRGSLIVCVLTGHGLKDPDRALQMVRPPRTIPATMPAVVRALADPAVCYTKPRS